ncbi:MULTISPECIES: hypothetical protein [unclassified Symbiopectobacterium]|uniref:hypothetical protein n=1 Tax=unclassified Symbiopectobacterium TaxID=2794573 RepID=UPI002226EB78|nr:MULTISPECIES: hypothetical protein [unclassified Symbiopectobacterium]MCW2473542.1 hypothetical protein [Candidatus Symbiopectobacterium sp. NZEC151]MCW2482681.1 hypothetical protein [Candidatus Symbiopectobacterium sp. NZEC135]MCW2484643.1 hypothetical protein [Candidatus Symbiopectobacterium sp. NZEC127]
MKKDHSISGKISFYASGIDSVRVSRPLNILNAMDQLEKYFSEINSEFSARIEYGRQLVADITSLPSPVSEELLTLIENDQESLRAMYQDMADNAGGVMGCCKPGETLYEELLQAMAVTKGLFDQQEALRWAIMEHNADVMPKGKATKLSSAEEVDAFFASL